MGPVDAGAKICDDLGRGFALAWMEGDNAAPFDLGFAA
jgi:hypothetical protein